MQNVFFVHSTLQKDIVYKMIFCWENTFCINNKYNNNNSIIISINNFLCKYKTCILCRVECT